MIKITDANGREVNVKKFNFPCGEMQVEIPMLDNTASTFKINTPAGWADVEFIFEKNEDIIELMLIVDSLNALNSKLNNLYIPYVPFARQDRRNATGEAFSLKVFCNLVNSFGFRKVIVTDPHSDVTTALLNNVQVIQQHEIWEAHKHIFDNAYIISPDAGALKKIYKVAERVPCLGVIQASKKRNISTGEITAVELNADINLERYTCVIVDDICDGGRTFIELAKVLKQNKADRIILCVTHGKFTKGLGVFDGLIDEIYTLKGKVK